MHARAAAAAQPALFRRRLPPVNVALSALPSLRCPAGHPSPSPAKLPATILEGRVVPAAMAFWGCEVKPGKPTPFVPPPDASKLHLSQACLSTKAKPGAKAALKVRARGGLLAALRGTNW